MSGLPFKDLLHKAVRREPLARDEAARAFQIMLNDGASPAQIAALLTALAMQPIQPDVLVGAASAIRAKMRRITAPAGALDTCGTGGDGQYGLNISTAVACVVAACGVPVAKHGNRAVSSLTGSADVLQALGVTLDLPPEAAEATLNEHGICFLMAPIYHPSLRAFTDVRRDLGMRTLMNALGPLCNPASMPYQLLGVYSPDLLEPMAQALQALGTHNAWVVHGGDGSDELSLIAPSQVVEVSADGMRHFMVDAADACISPASPETISQQLRGGDVEHNAARLRQVLGGTQDAYRDAVLLNAAAALCVAKRASTLAEGAAIAAQAIDTGEAKSKLAALAMAGRPFPFQED